MSETVYKKALKSKTFCIYPFTHMATKTDGSFKLCCRSDKLSSVQDTSVLDLWNSDKYKKIRLQFLNSEKPEECEACWSVEKFGTRSMRQRALRQSSHYSDRLPLLKDVSDDGTVPFLPKSIELKLSNLCNLKCRMCHPVDSSSWINDWPVISDLMKKYNGWVYDVVKKQNILKKPLISAFKDDDRWWQDFEKIADSLEFIDFAGGEPLMDPLHYKILDLLSGRASNIKLKYSTNLTCLDFKGISVLDYWKKFKGVSIYASIDGIHDVYEYIRTGASFANVTANLNQIIQDDSVCFDEVAIACTVQIYNAFQLPEIMDYFSRKGIPFHSHRVTYPTFLNTQVLPRELKTLATELILDYQRKLNKEKFFERTIIDNLNRHIRDHLNHMNGKDCDTLVPAFVDYTQRMDKSRETDVGSSVPELKSLFQTA